MMDLFKPAEKTALRKALGHCNACKPRVDALRQLGVDVTEYDERVANMESTIKRALGVMDESEQPEVPHTRQSMK